MMDETPFSFPDFLLCDLNPSKINIFFLLIRNELILSALTCAWGDKFVQANDVIIEEDISVLQRAMCDVRILALQ